MLGKASRARIVILASAMATLPFIWMPCAPMTIAAGLGAIKTDGELAARREEIAAMSPVERQELLRKQERFAALPAPEQDRLRQLQVDLDSDPISPRLHETLVRYHEWLKTLSAKDRAALADLPPEERVKQIKRLLMQQEIARRQQHLAELLSPKDLREIMSWIENLVWKHRDRLLKEMPSDERANWLKLDAPQQRRALLAVAFERSRRRSGPGFMALIESADVETLSAKLSDDAKAELADAEDLQAARKMLRGWTGWAIHRVETWQARRKLAPLVGEDLVQFFEHDLKRPDRERLLKMPQEQMRDELRRMYQERQRAELGFHGPDDPPRFKRRTLDRTRPQPRPPEPDKGKPATTVPPPRDPLP